VAQWCDGQVNRTKVLGPCAEISKGQAEAMLAQLLQPVNPDSVVINKRCYRNNMDSPKGRKGKNTTRTVALSPGTVADLRIWRSMLQDESEDAFLFPSEAGVTPLRPDNLWKRDIRPRLTKVGLGWVNFQVLRRTNASLSRKAKIDDKVSADQRGHGLGVSLGVYAISDLDQKIEAVTRLESEVIEAPEQDDLARLDALTNSDSEEPDEKSQ